VLDASHKGQIIVNSFAVFPDFLSIRLALLVKSVARVLDRQNVHAHLSPKIIQHIERKSYIFRIAVKVDDYLIASVLARQIQTGYVLCRSFHLRSQGL
jgi:hypothetical protein